MRRPGNGFDAGMYDLASYLPEQLEHSAIPIPSHEVSMSKCWTMRPWQGIGWLRPLYYFCLGFMFFVCVIILLATALSGDLGITILGLVVSVFLFFLGVIIVRVLIELLISCLFFPHIIAVLQQSNMLLTQQRLANMHPMNAGNASNLHGHGYGVHRNTAPRSGNLTLIVGNRNDDPDAATGVVHNDDDGNDDAADARTSSSSEDRSHRKKTKRRNKDRHSDREIEVHYDDDDDDDDDEDDERNALSMR